MDNFNKALDFLFSAEGGYSNRKNDAGGATNFGITQTTFNSAISRGIINTDITDVKYINKDLATQIYKHDYWNSISADKLPSGIDIALFDMTVIAGGNVIKTLQKTLGIKQDGIMEKNTINAINSYEGDLVKDFNNSRREYNNSIIENNQRLREEDIKNKGYTDRIDQSENKKGWENRVNHLEEFIEKEIQNDNSNSQNGNNNASQTDTEYINNELNKEKNIPEIDKSKLIADSDQIKTDGSSDYFVDEKNKTIYYFDENGNPTQVTYDNNSNLLIYGDPANPNKITFTDENGDYQVWQKDNNGNFVQTNKTDYSQVSNTAINQIGSLIIVNNQNFSNIEKIAVSSSVATIADYASYAQSGKDFEFQNDSYANLQGAVTSFAVSAYFAKNDNISDILGVNFIILNQFSQKSHKIIYNIISEINSVNNPSYLNSRNLFVG